MTEAEILEADAQLVAFELGSEIFGVEMGRVQEIIQVTAITKLPRSPEFVEGVINLRGKVIPVVDFKKRFGLEDDGRTRASRIVVVDTSGHTIGMVVDGVSEVLLVPAGAVEPPSPLVTTAESDYVRGIAKVEDRLVILLDLDRVLSLGEMEELQAVGRNTSTT
jgi:purine-binding chemotaxis protein CheW